MRAFVVFRGLVGPDALRAHGAGAGRDRLVNTPDVRLRLAGSRPGEVAREHPRSYTGFMGSRAAFVVPVHDLDVTGRSVEFKLTDAWLRGALEGCEIQPAPAGGVLT